MITCIHCAADSYDLLNGLCPSCTREKLLLVQRMVMAAPCGGENGTRGTESCTCPSCCTKIALVAIINSFANPKCLTAV